MKVFAGALTLASIVFVGACATDDVEDSHPDRSACSDFLKEPSFVMPFPAMTCSVNLAGIDYLNLLGVPVLQYPEGETGRYQILRVAPPREKEGEVRFDTSAESRGHDPARYGVLTHINESDQCQWVSCS